jgi:hypothetical protein
MMKNLKHPFLASLLYLLLVHAPLSAQDRGEVGILNNKFAWTGTGEVFVPNLIMIDVLAKPLHEITTDDIDYLIEEFMQGHGFNGVHVPVFGRWFHLEKEKVTEADSLPDPATFDLLKMIVNKVYQAGGCTYIWMWGDAERGFTAKSTTGGIMGEQERVLLDHISDKLGPEKGWMLGYGFDLWEWVGEEELRAWHDYLWAKPGWNHLLGARASKNELDQIYEGLDFSDYEFHKPWYDDLIAMIDARPEKPTLSGDRYRVRWDPPSKWPEKDYDEEETRRGLWHHALAGGIGAIWGKLDDNRTYTNKAQLKCFSIFWEEHGRFHADMKADSGFTDGLGISGAKLKVAYKENASKILFSLTSDAAKVVAVDTKKPYKELYVGEKNSGDHVFEAPYPSDWVLAISLLGHD